MRRIDFPHYIKPLLRDTGLTLLGIYLISGVLMLWSASKWESPGPILLTLNQFLDLSSLLAVATLMLALSLSEYSVPRKIEGQKPQIGFRDQILLRCRFLLALAAILYLLIIPCSFIQSQLLRNTGLRNLDSQTRFMRQQLQRAQKEMAAPSLKESLLPSMKQRYAPLLGREVVAVSSVADMRLTLDRAIKDLKKTSLNKQSEAEWDLTKRMLRISLVSLLYATLMAYFWYHWPTHAAKPPGIAPATEMAHFGVLEP